MIVGLPATRLDLGVDLVCVAGLPLFRGVLGADAVLEAVRLLGGIVDRCLQARSIDCAQACSTTSDVMSGKYARLEA